MVLVVFLCACGANDAKKAQEKADETLKVVQEADDYLKRLSAMEGYEYFDIQGAYDSKSNTYVVSVSYDTESIENALVSGHPNLRQYKSILDEYVQGFYDTLSENVLDGLMNTLIKDQVSNMFLEYDTSVVVQFTDPTGVVTNY